jgi:crossover junction endodeoxyribonuclease RuvC
VEWGTLRTRPDESHAVRLLRIQDGLAETLSRLPVEQGAIESWFVHPASTSAMGVAEARGVLLAELARAGLPVTEYSPSAIKQAVTGYGAADKSAVRTMVGRLCGARASSTHAADALAVAICHLGTAPLARAIRRAR